MQTQYRDFGSNASRYLIDSSLAAIFKLAWFGARLALFLIQEKLENLASCLVMFKAGAKLYSSSSLVLLTYVCAGCICILFRVC